jgi:drug/metabolite transporter (DMT)-like permease
MFRVALAMVVGSAATAMGQILIRRGMQQIGSLEEYAPAALVAYFTQVITNPNVIGGTLLNGVFYLLLITALSWAEVTVAVPFTALEYGFAAVLAITILQEAVPPIRWMGIVLVIVGVLLISLSGSRGAA